MLPTFYIKNYNYQEDIIFSKEPTPIFLPKKHTIESYRSQQRRAKKRRKNK